MLSASSLSTFNTRRLIERFMSHSATHSQAVLKEHCCTIISFHSSWLRRTKEQTNFDLILLPEMLHKLRHRLPWELLVAMFFLYSHCCALKCYVGECSDRWSVPSSFSRGLQDPKDFRTTARLCTVSCPMSAKSRWLIALSPTQTTWHRSPPPVSHWTPSSDYWMCAR